MILHGLLAMRAGWLQRHQPPVITSLREKKCVLTAPRAPPETLRCWSKHLITPQVDGSTQQRSGGRPGVAEAIGISWK
jgi:hypothetical protein